MDFAFAFTSGLLLGSFMWGVGVPVGYALAIRSAHRSSLRRERSVFRGLAPPWDSRVANLKAFPLWVISVGATTTLLFLLVLLGFGGTLLTTAALALILAWNALAGFQKGIVPAERVFHRIQGVIAPPQHRQRDTSSTARRPTTTHIVVERKEIAGANGEDTIE